MQCAALAASSKDRSNVNSAYTDETKSTHSSSNVAKSAAAAAGSIAAVSLFSEIAPGISKSTADLHISLSNRRVDDGSGKAIGINAESNSALRRQSVEGLSSAHSDGRIKDAKFVPNVAIPNMSWNGTFGTFIRQNIAAVTALVNSCRNWAS